MIIIKQITNEPPPLFFLNAIAEEIPKAKRRYKIQIPLEYATRHATIRPRFDAPTLSLHLPT